MSTSQENFTDAELKSLSIEPILIKFRHIGLVNALSNLKKLNEQLTPDEINKLYNDYYNFMFKNAAMNDDENKRIISEAVNQYITSFHNHQNLYTLDISKSIEKFYEENEYLPKRITKELITKYKLTLFEVIARDIGLHSFATADHTRNINQQYQELGPGYIIGGGNSKSNSSEKRSSSTRRRPSRKSSATKPRRRPRRRTARK